MTAKTTKKTPTRSRKKKAKIAPKAKTASDEAQSEPSDGAAQVKQVDIVEVAEAPAPATNAESTPAKPRTAKRKRGRKKTGSRTSAAAATDEAAPEPTAELRQEATASDEQAEPAPSEGKSAAKRRPKRMTGRASAKKREAEAASQETPKAEVPAPEADSESDTAVSVGPASDREKKPSSRRGSRKGTGGARQQRGRKRQTDDRSDAGPDFDEEAEAADTVPARGPDGKRTMLINVSAGDECRIAVVHQGRLEELFIERASSQSHVGSIYKGRVMNVEPSIQAAFIDFGLPKNGFLHISDVQPQYFPDYSGEPEDVGRKIPRRNRPAIQDCFRRGQEVIVQVIKEGVGTKGPTLTTYLSIPGRFLVMMPGMSRTGVSRKIEDDDARREMRDALNELKLPPGIGFILRTAGLGRPKRDLQRDLNYLLRLWKTVVGRVKQLDAPAELYRESDLVTRTLRDLYSSDFDRVVVDDADAARHAREFFQIAMPRSKAALEVYSDREPLFHRFGIEEELENINKREVPLRSGGSLVIDSTEALVAIDVNSGRFRSPDDAEEMAYRLNTEAAEEIARQLRLRDLGGLIICDFIDMRLDRHKRSVEKTLRDALKEHKERARILRMSAFGLIEMTRQRRGPSMKRNTYFECQHCGGTGLVKMPESVVLDVMRIIQLATNRDGIQRITVTVGSDVAYQMLNRKRAVLAQLETETGREIVIRGDEAFTSDQVECVGEDSRGHPIPIVAAQQRKSRR